MTRQWSQMLIQQTVVTAIVIIASWAQKPPNRLHISLAESDLLKYGDKVFVRIYQTVFSAVDGASQTIFPAEIRYKDIWQDAGGIILIVPGASLENPTWVGIGDPRNQIKFIANYKTQVNPADNPLIRSFLMDYETVRKVLNPRRIVTEDPKYNNIGLSINIDKQAANQFGLNHLDADELRKHALPESLVTYTSKKVDQTEYGHWGTIRPIEDLYDKLGLPSEDIPGAYSETQAKERIKGTTVQIDDYLQDLQKLYEKSQAGVDIESEIQRKLKEFNDKYIFEKISEEDLPIKGIDISFEKQKLKKKLKKQIASYVKELSALYESPNTYYGEVENKVNEYNEKFRSNVPEKLSPSELPTVNKDVTPVHKQLLGDIEKLNELHKRFIAGENVKTEMNTRLNKYNDFMVAESRELKATDLKNIKAYMKEARTRRQISERFHNDNLDPYLKTMDELQWEKIPKLKTDHMFTDGKDINMHELIEKGVKYKKQFQGARKFLTYVEAYSNELKNIIESDKSTDLNKIKNFVKNSKLLLKEAFPNDPQFLRQIEYGFFVDSGDFNDDRISKRLNDISSTVTKKISDNRKTASVDKRLKILSDEVAKRSQQVTYKSEVIVQLGSSTEVKKASKYLYNRYTKENKNVKHFIYDDGLYRANIVSGIYPDDTTRISVIGLGRKSQSHLHIGGKDPDTLAKDLSQVLFPKGSDEKVTVGKISLIACNMNSNEGVEIGSRFVQNFAEALEGYNMQSTITVRVGELQVSEDGYKLYGQISDLHHRSRTPVIVRNTLKDGKIVPEYGIINSNTKTIQWGRNVPEHVENTKILVLSKTYGSFDIAAVVEKTHLKSMKFVDKNIEKSGVMNFQQQDITVGTSHESQPNKHGMYLEMETPTDIGLPVLDETGLHAVLMEVDASELFNTLSIATSEATQALPDSGNWIPLIDTAEIDQNGKTKVTVVNLDTSETQSIEMKNDAFVQFKKKSTLHARYVRNFPKITKSTIGMAGTGSLLGFGGFIMSAIQLSKAKKCEANVTCPATEVGRKLAKSLEINAYVGFSMATYGLVSDSVQIAELAVGYALSKNAVNGIVTMTKTTSKFLQFSKVFGSLGMGVGAIGSVISLGFSANHLAHAETKAQKVEFGIQVGIDSVNVIASGVGVGATIASVVSSSTVVASIASTAGPVGLVVAVVGILTSVITGLAFEFKNTRNNARQVGEYFYILEDVYSQSGFDFDGFSKTFKILENAIVTSVDFENGIIQLDSQYIYRTRHGSTGSGKQNYFFWYNDFPKMIRDKNQAINIRSGIGYSWRRWFYTEKTTETLILPAIPKSYISYSYSRLPFCTAMHDKGFDIIRRLEQDYRFDYDFYIFPGEQIVSNIIHEYVNTVLIVKLTSNVKTIAVPDISNRKYNYLHNKYTFKLITKSQKHTLVLQDYYEFDLQGESSTPCIWYLSYASVNFDEVTFQNSGWITIGKVKIHVGNISDKLYVLDDNGGMLLLDPYKKIKTLTSIIQDSDTTSKDLKSYLKSMNGNWLHSQKYVVIGQFKQNGEYMGRAFYDTKSEIFLYTNLQGFRVSKHFKNNVQLLGVFQNDVYFMSNEGASTVIWRTHIRTKQVEASYVLYCGNEDFQISKLNKQGDSTLLIQNLFNVSLVYMMTANGIKLVFIDGQKENIIKLADTCFPTLHEFLPHSEKRILSLSFPGDCLYATTVPVLPLKHTLHNGTSRHFWLYMKESQIPPGGKNAIFCTPTKPPVATGIITPHIEDECNDLTLRDIQHLHTGEEVYFFYCEGDKKKFYYQVGDNESVQVFVPGEIERIEDFGVVKLIKSTNGGLYKFTETKNFTLAAFSFDNIAFQTNWKESFKNIAKKALVETLIPILNLKTFRKRDLTAWYDMIEDRLIIVSPSVDAQDIVYLGPSPSSFLVWLYNPKQRHVILQKILDDGEVSSMIVHSNNEAFWRDEVSPSAVIAASDVNSVEYTYGSVFVVTKAGVIITINYLQAVTFLGVNATWIENNNKSLGREVDKLCNLYQSQNLVTMGKHSADNNDTIYRWYHCAMQCQVVITTEANIQPVYLGMTQAEKLIFFVVGEDITQMDLNAAKEVFSEGLKIAKVKHAILRGKTLLLQSLDVLLHTVPKLDNVSSLVLSTAYGSKIIIEADDWFHYQNIVITSIGTSGPQIMSVKIHPRYHCSFQFDEVENDTVIKDPISERVIVLEDFTIHYDKYDEDYMPVGNEAVLRIEICDDKPVILVTNRKRFDPIMSKSVEGPTDVFIGWNRLTTIIIISVAVIVFVAGAVFVLMKCGKNKSQNKDQIEHPTAGKHRIQLNRNEESNETFL